jgi:dTDP-glucose 4,6-dehydratase
MHYFVSGGAGFIGSNFVELLISQSDVPVGSITVFDKLTYSGNMRNLHYCMSNPNFKFVEGDICNSDQVRAALKGVDYVIHFAAESHVDNSINHAGKFVETNVLGTQQLLEVAMKEGIKKFVHVSTDEVYGSVPEGSSDENSLLRPNSPYSASKAGSDLICRAYFETYGFPVLTTRSANNYGKYQHPEKLIPRMVDRLSKGKSIPLYGNGLNVREWIQVSDHCRAILKVLHSGEVGGIYNVGSGLELSNLDVARKVLQIMNLSEDRIEYVQDRKGHDFRYKVDRTRITELGHENRINWETGIVEYVEWHLKNANHWFPND